MNSNIDNLNFKVILDDENFNDKIDKDIKAAKELNTQLSTLLEIKGKLGNNNAAKNAIDEQKLATAKAQTAAAEERLSTAKRQGQAATERLAAATANRTAAEARAASAVMKTAKAQRAFNTTAAESNGVLSRQGNVMRELKSLAATYLSIRGIGSFLSSMIRVTGEFELQKTTLSAMLGDLNEAERVMTKIKGLAIESPFKFKELATYAKQLSAFSVPAKELYETTKMLADVSAGLGVGMDRIVLAYGQVRSAAFLRGQEVRQFTEAGIPILNELAKQFEELEGQAVSTGEVFDRISARLVPFEMVAKVFKDMTSEGGKFYKMQEVQAETLRGKISNLKDAYEVMLNEIGSQESGALKGAVDSIRSLMQNWQMVAAAIKTVIATLAAYKASMLLITSGQWVATFVQTISQWKKMNEILKFLNLNTIKFSEAMKAAGISAKAMASGSIAIVAALVVAIANAVKNANALRKELESIMTHEGVEQDKMINDIRKLSDNLKNAKQGSQEYRDVISELNRKYADYLPNILSEAQAYGEVKAAVDAAAEAIRNKAKANAFEKGSAAIEEDFGKDLTKRTSNFLAALKNMPNISAEAASEFIKNFNLALSKEGAMDDVEKTLQESFDSYFGAGKFKEYEINFALGSLVYDANQYAKIRSEVIKAEKQLQQELDARFGEAEFSSFDEREKIGEVEKWYRDQLSNNEDALKKLELTQDAYNKKVEDLNIEKLRKLVDVYKDLGREDIAKDYQDQIDALTKIPEGWRGKVQNILTQMGLTKGTSFGLWAEDTTQSTSYVDEMIKRYKELKEEIGWVESFDPKQAERLGKEKDAIEAIAKALKIDIANLAANKSEKTESIEEKRIKRLVDALRTLQDQYEKLKSLGASDESIKKLFRSLYPDLIAENGDEFVTDLKYLERAKDLIEDLSKLNPSDAKKLLVALGEDEFSALVKTLQKQEKAYKDSAKAASEYFNELRKWSAEDFSLAGEGITLDISKIASGLNEKINEINLRATKIKEAFGQIDLDSEEEIAKVKEIFVKEFGPDAWEEFWNSYYYEGLGAVQRLADRQAEYERKLAQEKINDLAQKYVKESYFTEGIELTDLGDKTLSQIRSIKKKLQDVIAAEPLQVPIELQNKLKDVGVDIKDLTGVNLDVIYEAFEHSKQPIDASTQAVLNLIQQIQQAGLSTEKFGDVIKKVFEGDLKELTEEEGKLLSEMIEGYLDEMRGLFESVGDFAEKIGSDKLQGAMNGIAQSMEILGGVADKLAKGDWIGAIISGVTSLAEVILNAAAAQEELKRAIAETRNEMQLLASEKAIAEGTESIFGIDDYKKFQNAYDEAVKAHKKATEDIQRQNMLMWGAGKDDWGQWGVAGAAGTGAALGAAIGSIFPVIGTAIGAGIGALAGMITGLIGRAATEANNYAKSLQTMADEIGGDLIEEDTGTFNVETLKKIKETYKDLDSEYKDILDKLITNAEVFENAVTEMANYMTDIFGQCADDMADSFIESFKKSGQAALDYGAIVDDVATNIAKSIIKSTILQSVWSDEKSKEAAQMLASGDAASAMAVVDEAMKSAQALAPHIQDLLEALKPYFEMETDTESTLGTGIQKGITEDTANLLASYINAMRSDVSLMKGVQLKYLPAIGETMPNIMDHLARIQANTFDISQSNARVLESTSAILAELRSVLTSEGGERAVRIIS